MSETTKICLQCGTTNTKYEYQEIFDELGLELDLANLLNRFHQLNVKPLAKEHQWLCEICINNLINLFDIDELQKEKDRDVTNNSNNSSSSPAIVKSEPANKKQTRSQTPKKELAKSAGVVTPAPAEREKPRVSLPAKAMVKVETLAAVAVALAKAKPTPTILGKRAPAKESVLVPTKKAAPNYNIARSRTSRVSSGQVQQEINALLSNQASTSPATSPAPKMGSGRAQEQINALIRNILEDEDAVAADDPPPIEEEREGEEEPKDSKILKEELLINEICEESGEELAEEEFFINEEYDSDLDGNVNPISASQSQTYDTEDENVDMLDLLPIREDEVVGDLYEYLLTVVKTAFENLTFKWDTDCRHCSVKCCTFESLLAHMVKQHKRSKNCYTCPLDDCEMELAGHKLLAMHLVLQHAPVNDILIYGSCPECKMTFSNIMLYNKHSCAANLFKKQRGTCMYCEMCNCGFPSWKRFNFHTQFHLEKHRPKACFICNYVDCNLDELFHHLYYAHEPEGTLFCDLCDRTFRQRATFEDHQHSHTHVGSYICNQCGANFESRGRYNGHMRTVHGTVISCVQCNREFATEVSLKNHMKTHLIVERKVHVCDLCGLISDHRDKLLPHTQSEDSECFGADITIDLIRQAFICEYCSSYYHSKENLRTHRESGVHSDGLYWCQPCIKEFPHIKQYRSHLSQQKADPAHQKLEICLYYMCDQGDCEDSYANWNSLYTHKQRNHGSFKKEIQEPADEPEKVEKDKQFICQFCQKVCPTKMSLSVHVARSHNNNNVTCELCYASYKDEAALVKHHAYWHQPIECPQCFKMVKNRRNYDTHVKVVHTKVERYKCSMCVKGFYHKSEKDAHELLHTQLFNCNLCQFTTRNKKSLSVHVQGQHYKNFPFECKVCEKRFGRKQGLTSHMKQHMQKYICRDFIEHGCRKKFVKVAQLNNHVRKAHNSSVLVHYEISSFNGSEDATEDEEKPSTSKRRCFKIDDTNIEFIGPEAESGSADEDFQQIDAAEVDEQSAEPDDD